MLTKLQNHQQLNNDKHKFRKRMVPISNSFVDISRAHSLRTLAPLGFFALFFANVTVCNVSAESVSISVSSAAETFALAPGSSSAFGKSGNITASIVTDYPYGYEFTVAGPNDEQKLKSTSSHLSSITSATTENNFKAEASTVYNNTWGFLPSKVNSISNTEYQPAPTKSAPTPIDVTTAANPDTANSYTFAITARVDNTVPKETYSSDFTLAAVANYAYFGIGFADVSNGIPAVIHGLTNNGNVTFTAPAAPTKTGYTFKGWCSVETGENGSCNNGTTYEAGTEYTISLSNNFINTYTTLYATWEIDTVCTIEHIMQKVSDWAHCLDDGGLPVTAIDSRDNKTYQVAKMPDGKIWMLDNLALAETENDLSSDDTNVPDNWEGWTTNGNSKKLPASASTGFYDYEHPMINTDSITGTKDNVTGSNSGTDSLTEAGSWKFGAYYNYCAASAGSVCDPEDTQPSITDYTSTGYADICPSGWHMPSGSEIGEYQELSALLNGATGKISDREKTEAFRKKLHLPLSGGFHNNSAYNQGMGSDFWSSSSDPSSAGRMYYFAINASNIYPQGSYNRGRGFSIRCIAQ